MSDGPYRTLQMSPKWKALAKLAGNDAHEITEVIEAIPAALTSDWNDIGDPFLRKVRAALGDDSGTLLMLEVANQDLRRLRDQAANPMQALLADYAQDVLRDGMRGASALLEAAAATLAERADRGARQVQEHYLWKASHGSAAHIRTRLNSAVLGTNLQGLAASLVSGISARELSTLKDRSGIDQGVNL